MTAENNGTGAPGDDDPFAYLYRPEGGGTEGGAASAQQPGVPRRSYHQVRAVGERQYGAQGYGQQGYGQQAPSHTAQQPGTVPGQAQGPSAHYAAPETMAGGRAAMRQQGGGAGGPGGPRGSRGGGRGGNRNGLLIGAVAVVAAVVAGIGAAMIFNEGDSAEAGPPDDNASASSDGGQQSQEPDGKKTEKPDSKKLPPKKDVATFQLAGGAKADKATPGAKGEDGTYVSGMNTPGATATWKADIPKSGTYDLHVRYAVPGKNMHLSLDVNGKPHATGLRMKNHAKAKEGDWENAWTFTWATIQADKGSNTFKISCGDDDDCDVNLDQVWFKPAG